MTSAVLMTACNSDDVPTLQTRGAIEFSTAYVGGNSRNDPSMTTDSLKSFNIYGSLVKDGVSGAFANNPLLVSRTATTSNSWTYSPVQYWIPGTTYYFGATYPTSMAFTQSLVAGSNGDASYTQTLSAGKFDNNGATDVIAAMPSAILAESTMSPVTLNFHHLLSKVTLTFVNGFNQDSGIDLWVEYITISAPYTKADSVKVTSTAGGDVDVVWSPDSLSKGSYSLGSAVQKPITASGSPCADPVLMLPASADATYTVTFSLHILQNGYYAEHYNMTATISGVQLKAGNAYNFTATLDASNVAENPVKPITFAVSSIVDWDTNTEDLTTGNTAEN